MNLYVRLAEPDMNIMIELQHWLARDDRIPPESRHGAPASPGDGQLGTTVDVLQLIIGSAITLGQLIVSIAQWRQSRPDRPTVLISAERPDGVAVSIESSDPKALAEVVRQLRVGVGQAQSASDAADPQGEP
jgi:hypothetical protein